ELLQPLMAMKAVSTNIDIQRSSVAIMGNPANLWPYSVMRSPIVTDCCHLLDYRTEGARKQVVRGKKYSRLSNFVPLLRGR
ncbi:MAG: hypothetical protein KTR32_13990, partial [Granulosicoccus sp.]|nr:hypothetical protein [Granulosicoccus sp.]